jgi:hypothetical protein
MAKGRRLRAARALVLVVALGCAREPVPTELIGRWTSDDPRYADRVLEIGAEQIAFGVGSGMRMAYRTKGMERELDPATGTLYRLYYDAPGEPERALLVRLATPGRLRIDNHSEVWTRAASSAGG